MKNARYSRGMQSSGEDILQESFPLESDFAWRSKVKEKFTWQMSTFLCPLLWWHTGKKETWWRHGVFGSEFQFPVTAKSLGQLVRPSSDKKQSRNGPAQLPPFHSAQEKWYHPQGVGLLASINIIRIPLPQASPRAHPQGILDSVKWIINSNHGQEGRKRRGNGQSSDARQHYP